MRDPKRIDEVLNVVRHYWQQWPDLRLLQLLLNCVDDNEFRAYNIEDHRLVEVLHEKYGDTEVITDDGAT